MTKEEKQIIVDALLFSASCEICANWKEGKQRKMIEIAEALKTEPSSDIEFWADPIEIEEPWSKEIPKKFKIKEKSI